MSCSCVVTVSGLVIVTLVVAESSEMAEDSGALFFCYFTVKCLPFVHCSDADVDDVFVDPVSLSPFSILVSLFQVDFG